jgi:hypothetical protein
VLGAASLAITVAEALYAEMGRFGRFPIRLAWFGLVLPALVLNYFGQGALLLEDKTAIENRLFQLLPGWGLVPLVLPVDRSNGYRLPGSNPDRRLVSVDLHHGLGGSIRLRGASPGAATDALDKQDQATQQHHATADERVEIGEIDQTPRHGHNR